MKGVSYRVGANRGRMVTVVSTVEVADIGALSVTDHRVVFSGSAKTLEFRYDKLAGIELFTDGIRLGVTNRQNACLFILDHIDAVAAVINAAVKRVDSRLA